MNSRPSPSFARVSAAAVTIWICTDMEGLAGVDTLEACYEPDLHAPVRQQGLRHLVADTNAAIEGAFLGGATRVLVWDGHGLNRSQGLRQDLDPRAEEVFASASFPVRFDSLNDSVDAVVMVGQHALAGTAGAFLSHTQALTEISRCRFNGVEHGEMSQIAAYAGYYGIPLIAVSGDEALCEEARRLFPGVIATPTKRGLGWAQCDLYPVDEVREAIRRDTAAAVHQLVRGLSPAGPATPWNPALPLRLSVEYDKPDFAETQCAIWSRLPWAREVRRVSDRTVEWTIDDPRNAIMIGPVLHPEAEPFSRLLRDLPDLREPLS